MKQPQEQMAWLANLSTWLFGDPDAWIPWGCGAIVLMAVALAVVANV